MLATPLLPILPFASQHSENATQYRPVKDAEAFNALLPPAIEFIEGSSTGALALPETKYQPINENPQVSMGPPMAYTSAQLALSPETLQVKQPPSF